MRKFKVTPNTNKEKEAQNKELKFILSLVKSLAYRAIFYWTQSKGDKYTGPARIKLNPMSPGGGLKDPQLLPFAIAHFFQ